MLRIILDKIAFKLGYVKKSYQLNIHSSAQNTFGKKSLLLNFYSLLKAVDFDPKHIIDVGANHGSWTREALTHFPDCFYTLIEPQAHMRASVADLLQINPKVSFYGVGAGKQPGVFDFTIVERDDSCSFIYSKEEAQKNNYQQIQIPVVTLNEFMDEHNLPIPGIIKIDAEGSDLEVLEGASNFFGKTEVFLVEAGVVTKAYQNSLLIVVDYMNKHGYRLFDITDLNRPFNSKALWLTELAFVKKGGLIDNYNWGC